MKKLTTNIKEKCRAARTWWIEEVCRKSLSGITVIELVLILVIVIALLLIFKNQLISLINTIFDKIISESSGI